MGCDVHICIQRREPEGWREVVYQKVYENIGQKPVDGIPVAPGIFDSRRYNLFGILANVRNGEGFAGIRTGAGWPSIAPERGWPAGFDAKVIAPNPQYPAEGPRDMGDHSFTWVGLDELKAFPWDDLKTTLYGVVPTAEYERLLKTGETPTEYSGSVVGSGIAVYDPPTYLALKRSGQLAEKPYVRMAWKETARQATGNWPGKVIPWLEGLADGRELRLVLGFDS